MGKAGRFSQTPKISAQPVGMLNRLAKIHLEQYRTAKQLEDEANTIMAEYETREQEMLSESGNKNKQPDDQGFVTVMRKKPKSALATLPVRDASKKQPPQGLSDFYRFQLRDAKYNKLFELRKKFEEDKLQIAKLKQSRVFRPY